MPASPRTAQSAARKWPGMRSGGHRRTRCPAVPDRSPRIGWARRRTARTRWMPRHPRRTAPVAERMRVGLADLRIGRCDPPLGGGNVRASLQQRRGHADRNGRHRQRVIVRRQLEAGRRLADQGGDRMLALRAGHAQVHLLCLRALELRLRQRQVGGRGRTGIELLLHYRLRLAVACHGLLQQPAFRIELAGACRRCGGLVGFPAAAEKPARVVTRRPTGRRDRLSVRVAARMGSGVPA